MGHLPGKKQYLIRYVSIDRDSTANANLFSVSKMCTAFQFTQGNDKEEVQ